MDRRSFLKGLGALGAGALASRLPFPELAGAQSVTRLGFVGDVGTGDSVNRAVADAMAGSGSYSGLVLLGDNVYPAGDPAKLKSTVFGPYANVLDSARLCATLGNHDVKNGNAAGQMRALNMPGRWYARTFGDVLLVCLDTNSVASGQQRSWLESTLRGATQRWRVAALHEPPYSGGMHGSNLKVRNAWEPLFRKYGVQLVVAGHDHNYQRSKPQGGVTYVVSGGGGGSLYQASRKSFTADLARQHHFIEVVVGGSNLSFAAIDRGGRQLDGATLSL